MTRDNPRFTLYAWIVLGWNVLVILWGAYVRASGSGAGCGSHWPLCNGEVLPTAPEIKTIIEFTHRTTSGVALLGVLGLIIWAFRAFPPKHLVRKFSTASLVLILLEAALGAGLVKLGFVEKDSSVGRAVYLCAHLANTQLLLAALALAAWFSRPDSTRLRFTFGPPKAAGLLPVALLVGISGAIAALGDTLFHATSLAEGMRQEMSSTAHFLLRLRIFHPGFALLFAVYASFVIMQTVKTRRSCESASLAWTTWGVLAVQMIAGAVNVWMLAPIWMQIVHLLLADILWILLVLMLVESAPRTIAT